MHTQVLSQQLIEFERLQKLELHSTTEIGHGSPVVCIHTSEPSIIGVYIGETKHRGQDTVVTLYGILQLLQG